jgi:WD40 repeat protein
MNERSIFLEALDKEDPSQRSAFLDAACAGDQALRQRIEALMKSHAEAGNFLGKLAPQRVAEALGGQPTGGATPAETPGDSLAAEDLGFLAPSDRPGVLGRLGHYEVHEVIGRGGMGVVLRAFDETLRRVVAIKVMAPQLATSATARQRFVREAQAAAAVRNEHVINIHGVDEAGPLPYLVMEYVCGMSLQERLDRGGPLGLKEVLRIGLQTAAGLAAAHAQGLVHRDVKPANILLENGVQRVKLTDFGLARAVDHASLTQSGVLAGTPQYMAPEQASGEPVDHRADLFSLGSVLYAMCTGQAPFRAGGTMAVLKRVSEDTPRPIREINPDVPDWLCAVITRLHAKDPAERFQSAAEVAELLGQYLAHLQEPALVPMPERVDYAPRRTSGQGPGRRRWVAAAAVLLLLGGGLGLSEATGVTRVAATVLRLVTADGILVVEVDDPRVKVTIEGDGGLVIAGAGPQEVRLRPGSYRLLATRDGRPIKNEVITITRGDKQVVKVSLEGRREVRAISSAGRLLGHTDIVWCVAFCPDGRRALSAGFDGCVRVWDVESRQERRRFEGHEGPVWAVAVSPDGRRALSGSAGKGRAPPEEVDWSVCLWEVESGKELRRTEGRGWGITCVAFSPDGRRALLGHYEGTVRLWDLEQWKEIRRFDHMRNLWSVCFSPDGHSALTAGGWEGALVRLWDLDSGRELRQLEGDPHGYFQAVFSPDGRSSLAAAARGNVTLWDVETEKVIRHFPHSGDVASVAFSPDGRYAASGGDDMTVRLWHVATGEERLRLEGHRQPIRSVAFSPDGCHVLSGSKDRTVRLWRIAEPAGRPR